MANRNRVEMSKNIFNGLIDRAKYLGSNINNSDRPRYLRKKSDEDLELMSTADMAGHLMVARHMRAITFSFNGQLYGAFFIASELDLLPPGFSVEELTPGLFAVAIVLSGVTSNASAASIRDAIEADFMIAGSDYQGHGLAEIAVLFPNIQVFALNSAYDYISDIYRLVGTVAIRINIDGPLPFSSELRNQMIDIFEGGSEYIPYVNIVQGLLSIHWGGLFIELYRCIEQLFAVPKLIELGSEINHGKSLKDLAVVLEKSLAWRPKEEESLGKILACCDQSTLLKAASALSISDVTRMDTLPFRLAGAIYNIRNNMVHFRPIHKNMNFQDREWDLIIQAMIDITKDVYNHYGQDFHKA